jgi:hypothetical protein
MGDLKKQNIFLCEAARREITRGNQGPVVLNII